MLRGATFCWCSDADEKMCMSMLVCVCVYELPSNPGFVLIFFLRFPEFQFNMLYFLSYASHIFNATLIHTTKQYLTLGTFEIVFQKDLKERPLSADPHKLVTSETWQIYLAFLLPLILDCGNSVEFYNGAKNILSNVSQHKKLIRRKLQCKRNIRTWGGMTCFCSYKKVSTYWSR